MQQLDALKAKIQSIVEQNHQLRSQVSTLEHEKHALEEKLHSLQSTLAAQQERSSHVMSQQQETLTASIAELIDSIDALEQEA